MEDGASAADATKPDWPLARIVENLTRSGRRWPNSGGGATTITYGFTAEARFVESWRAEYPGFRPFAPPQREAARIALQSWSDVANVVFVEVADPGGGSQVRFANTTSESGHAWAYYPGPGTGGDVWINPRSTSNLDLAVGEYGLYTLIHEVGHALGLMHPGDYDAGEGYPSFAADARYAQDTRQYTVMSYWSAWHSGGYHAFSSAATALLHDIAAIQAIYGANPSTRAGDTVYGFHSTAGRTAFDFTINRNPVVALYDAGGTDTLDLSGFWQPARIDLRAGAFSDGGGLTGNLAIAIGTWIENAVGGPGDDTLYGNEVSNRLDGGAGDDILRGGLGDDLLIGGAGTDTAAYDGFAAQYAVAFIGYGTYTILGPEGADRLDGVERLQFSSGEAVLIKDQLTASAPQVANTIAWQNDDGTAALWRMHGTTALSAGTIGFNPGRSWFVAATADAYGDNLPGLVWRNQDGGVAVWRMDGTTIAGGGLINWNPGPAWRIAAVADVNGDRKSDLLWQHDDGSVALWLMDGTAISGGGVFGLNPGAAWRLKAVADFFGDGRNALLWQHEDGSVAIWKVSGTTIIAGAVLPFNPGSAWRIKDIGRFDDDGIDDILWQHDSGMTAIWTMTGSTIQGGGLIPLNPGPAWHVRGAGDFRQDGNADIIWQHEDGAVAIWEMNGTTIAGGGGAGANPGSGWHVVGRDGMRFISAAAPAADYRGTPASDCFVMTAPSPGVHTISGFNPAQDFLRFSTRQFADYAALLARLSTDGAGSLITLDPTTSVRLADVGPDLLRAGNVVFI